MANKRPFNRQLKLLIIVILLFEFQNSLQAEGLFSSFQQSIQRRLFKPTSLVKGFFKSFKPFQELPPSAPLTNEDYLMQQAFNSPTGGLLPLGSNNNNNLPISEYLVSNFDRLNINPNTQGNNFKKDQMSLSESIPRSTNIFYPNNLMTSGSINHNLMYDQSQKTQSDLDDYPASQTVNYREPKEKSGPSISIGSAPGGGLGLKLGKFQMTFRRGNDGPQINLGTHDESSDQEAENSYLSMTRAKNDKKGMNIKLGKALQFSIGGNQDEEDKIKGSSSNRNAINLKENFLNRKSNQNNNLMPSASENSYEESPGIQLPAISIGGGNGGRPAITIGGGESDDENGNSYARPQITIGGGDPDQPQNNNYNNNNNNNNNYNNNNNNNYNSGGPPPQSGNNGWNDHWERPRIRLKMPDMPQTYIEKNLKLPPIKLKINAAPRVKITTGTKDPLEKKPIEEDPDMEDIFRPPEPFNTTIPGKDKNETNTDINDVDMNNNGFNNNNGMFGHKFDPNFNHYSDPNYQQYPIQQQNNYPEQINFVSKQQFDEQQSYENNHNKYYSYNYQTDQQTKYQYENTVGETKSSRSNYNNNSNRRPKNEKMQREPSIGASNDVPIYNDQGYARQPSPPNYNTYHVDNNRYPIKQNNNNNNYNQMNHHNYPPPPQLPNQYNQPPAPFNGGSYNNNQQSHQQAPNYNKGNSQYQNNNYNNNNNNHHGPYGGKTKEQIEEENSIYIKSKDEYAEDRPQIIMHMRPKISISHANATHPEEKKDPRHKNPFLKMIMEPEFVNHTTAAPEFDDEYGVPGYNKHHLNHYDFNKYKGHKPGKYGINYVKRTTTPRPLVDKTNRKSLTTTESPIKSDADDSDYYDETTTVMTTTTTTTNSPTKDSEEDEETSTKSTGSTTKDPDDELENPTTASDKTTESSSSRSTTASSDDDDDDDDTTKKLTTTSKPGQTTTASTTTTDNPLNKKLTTSKPAKKATTSTTLAPEDYEDYDFGFLTTKCEGKEVVLSTGKKVCRRRKSSTTTKLPSTSLDDDDDSTTESSTKKSNDDEDSNEKIVAPKKKEEDFFTKMMNKIRSEKNGSSDKEETTSKATTEQPSTTTDSDDDDDDVEPTLSTTTSKSKIRGRSQTDRSEALIVTEQPTSLAPKRNLVGSARKAANKLDNNKSGINFSNNDEKEDKTDKSMLIHLIRMVNDTMEEVRQHMLLSKEHTTPCPIDSNLKTSTITSTTENESKITTTTDENEDDDDDDKKNSTTDQSIKLDKSSTSTTTTSSESSLTSTESSSTTSKNEDEDESEENSEESSTATNDNSKANKKDESDSTTVKPTTIITTKETEITNLEQTSEKSNEKDNDNDNDDEDSEKVSTVKLTSSSTEKTTVVMSKSIEKSDKRRITSTKKVNSNGVKSKSTFEMNEEKLVSISSTESSVLFSSSSKIDSSSSTNSIMKSVNGDKSTKDEDKILNDTSLDSKSLPSNQLDDPELIDQQKESNEPIIVVLLPNEDSKL